MFVFRPTLTPSGERDEPLFVCLSRTLVLLPGDKDGPPRTRLFSPLTVMKKQSECFDFYLFWILVWTTKSVPSLI